MKKAIAMLILAITILFFGSTASKAYLLDTTVTGEYIKWAKTDMPVKYYINEDGYSGTEDEFDVVKSSFQTWNDVSGTYNVAEFAGTTINRTVSASDSFNNIVFYEESSQTTYSFEGGTLAICIFAWYPTTGDIIDADIIVNGIDNDWATDGSQDKYDIQSVLTHEIGHFWGLSDLYDDSDSGAMMYGYSSAGEIKRQLTQDDIAGLKVLYEEVLPQTPYIPTAGSNYEDIIFPETGDLSSNQNLWREDDYVQGERTLTYISSINSLTWEIEIEENILDGDTQDQALYINNVEVGTFSFTEEDLESKTVSFDFETIDITDGIVIQLITTRTVSASSGSVSLKYDQSHMTFYSENSGTPPTPDTPTPQPETLLELQADSFVNSGDDILLSVRLNDIANVDNKYGVKIGDYCDAYLSVSIDNSDDWILYVTYDFWGNPIFVSEPTPIVSYWQVEPFEWLPLLTIAAPDNPEATGIYRLEGHLVPPWSLPEKGQGNSVTINIGNE